MSDLVAPDADAEVVGNGFENGLVVKSLEAEVDQHDGEGGGFAGVGECLNGCKSEAEGVCHGNDTCLDERVDGLDAALVAEAAFQERSAATANVEDDVRLSDEQQDLEVEIEKRTVGAEQPVCAMDAMGSEQPECAMDTEKPESVRGVSNKATASQDREVDKVNEPQDEGAGRDQVRKSDRDGERGYDRDRERSREGSKRREREREEYRRSGRERSRELDKRRDRERSRDRYRGRERSRERDRERERDRRRSRRRSRSRSRSRERKKRSYSMEKPKRRTPSRSRSRGRRSAHNRSRSGSRPRRNQRSRSSESEGLGGYVPRKRAEAPTAVGYSMSYIDPYQALRSKTIQAVDPQQLQKQMLEQQLRARQLVLQQQAASAVAAASKTQREVYVGNLVSGLVTEAALRELFNKTMAAAFPDKVVPGLDPVLNVSMHSEGRYAFVELRTAEMATSALQLNGQLPLLGQAISVGRPSGYVDPTKAQAAAAQSAVALAEFQAQQLQESGVAANETGVVDVATAVIGLDHMVSAQALADNTSYAEVIADLKDECARHGMVLRVLVPRPADPAQSFSLFGTGNYGRAFVQFLDKEVATQAKDAMHGRLFDGNTVQVSFVHPEFFLRLVKSGGTV